MAHRTPQRLGLCIGINDYPGTGMDLQGCVNDAKDWAQLLSDRSFDVQTLLDGQATKAKLIEQLNDYTLNKIKSGDTLVITYSGHGTYVRDLDGDEPDGTDEAICPYDVMAGQVLTDDELYTAFSMRPHGSRLVFISDSCHSGTVNRFAPTIDPVIGCGGTRVRFLPPAVFMLGVDPLSLPAPRAFLPRSKPAGTSALLVAGCRDAEYSYDATFGNRPNGAFTYVAIKAYRETQPRNYSAWFKAIRDGLPTQEYPQSPQLMGTKFQKSGWPALE
jgi:hypothetical protein